MWPLRVQPRSGDFDVPRRNAGAMRRRRPEGVGDLAAASPDAATRCYSTKNGRTRSRRRQATSTIGGHYSQIPLARGAERFWPRQGLFWNDAPGACDAPGPGGTPSQFVQLTRISAKPAGSTENTMTLQDEKPSLPKPPARTGPLPSIITESVRMSVTLTTWSLPQMG